MKYMLIVLALLFSVYAGYWYGTRETPAETLTGSPTPSGLTTTTIPADGNTPISPAGTQKPAAQAPKETTLPRIALLQCVATPNSLTLKQDSNFAIDNLDYTGRKVRVSMQTFNIAPRDYVTVFASPVGIHSIECDGAGVATLTVQP
ncbi:MAG: hypothetical protein Q7S09_01395 [bacterium]|nr:hypothetical protein [bacterium]